MTKELLVLCAASASLGFFHTIFGPDHYLPFIAMGKARRWTLAKIASVTFLCGAGHIAGSVVLGLAGVIFGVAIMKLEALEAFRGNIAAWALIGFGFAYFIWGLRKAIRNRPHHHIHAHGGQGSHSHKHVHAESHTHVHDHGKKNITPWILFTIFILGPCEPLIPILMYPAAKNNVAGLFLVTGIFGLVTIVTMLGIVTVASLGINLVPLGRVERYNHALAGATICLSGLTIRFLGL
ncbi:MAG: sulfite exporter TauE/SafE family protein [Omnitrophica bacterium]|nr:sulfite exporter TauE/SafE family protein [Candidatus Omnitrophota bacterium]